MSANQPNCVCLLSLGFVLTFTAQLSAEAPPAKAAKPQKAPPRVPFKISKETTWITKPLKTDGTPDYAAALNTLLSKDVTPENNAAVPLMRAFGSEILPQNQRRQFFKMLGIPMPKQGERKLLKFDEFLDRRLKAQEAESEIPINREPYWDQQSQAMERPWSQKEFPLVSDWIDLNSEALRFALDASEKPRLFFPIVVPENETLISAILPTSVIDIRELARLFIARAMLSLHEGQTDDAVRNLLACHRLANLVGHEPTHLHALVSYALDAMACEADLALVASKGVSAKQFSRFRKKVQSLPAPTNLSEKFDCGERFIALDAICNVAVGKLDPSEVGLPNEKLRDRLIAASVNWEIVLERFNNEYDQMVKVLGKPTYTTRRRAIKEYAEKLDKQIVEPNQFKQSAWTALKLIGGNPPRKEISRRAANLMLAELSPLGDASDAEFRARSRRDLIIIALALAEYRLDKGEYPENLSRLSPELLKEIPKDRFTGKPLQYKKQKTGFLLYSLGPNLKDDGGKQHGEEGDDIAIRVPREPAS